MNDDDNSNIQGDSNAVSTAAVVSEVMVTEASRAGDLDKLRQWARQGIRVSTSGALICAVARGLVEVVTFLVSELGADVNEGDADGDTNLIAAVVRGQFEMVQCLVELGADVNRVYFNGATALILAANQAQSNLHVVQYLVQAGARIDEADDDGNTAVIVSARYGQYAILQWMLEHTRAKISETSGDGATIWDLLTFHMAEVRHADHDSAALIALLRVLVLHSAPSPALVALLSPEPARVVQEGARLRARLPAYLARRLALLGTHCPVLLPPLLDLVHGYMELTTTEELWATGLGAAP
jgi:hypothetical protein